MVIARSTRNYFNFITQKKAQQLICRKKCRLLTEILQRTCDARLQKQKILLSNSSLPCCVASWNRFLSHAGKHSLHTCRLLQYPRNKKIELNFQYKTWDLFFAVTETYSASFRTAQCWIQNWSVESVQKERICFWIAIKWLIQRNFTHSISA